MGDGRLARLAGAAAAGFPVAFGVEGGSATAITITPTHEAGPGLHSAIIQAAKPAIQYP